MPQGDVMNQMTSSKHVQPKEDEAELERKIIDGYSRKKCRVLMAH